MRPQGAAAATLPSIDVPEPDLARISSAFERHVLDTCPEHVQLAMQVLGRLTPARWILEWHLPWWLADAFGLDRAAADQIVLSNVLGLASVRLLDDIADGEIPDDQIAAATPLGGSLYQAALAPYRRLFGDGSPFWQHLERCMTAWRSAARASAVPPAAGPGIEHLAARGAPLKVCAFAICLLTGREGAFPILDRCLDHALAGLVLYDDLGDWRADLAAGRWNAFVASVGTGGGTPGEVVLAMLTEDAVAAYAARIAAETRRAAELAAGAGVLPLAEHLSASALQTEIQGAALQAHYRHLAEQAESLLLGGSPSVRSADRPFAATITATR